MTERIYLSSPDVTQHEVDAVVRAMRSGWIAPLGPEVDAFEAELARFTGREYAVALSSGTAALHLALLTLGVGSGDIVLTSTLTFAATANAIAYTGAEPVFVDSDMSGNMSPAILQYAFETLAREGRVPRVVVPVDLFGKVANHERIHEIASQYDAVVLSDAAESLGATRNGSPSAAFGVAAAVSFNGNKVMTTSGGGALLTDDAEIAHRVRYLATQARQPVAHYQHTEIGYNYRLSNLLAALGRAQLSRLDKMIERRRQIRYSYRKMCERLSGIKIFGEPADAKDQRTRDNCWLSSILVDSTRAGFEPEDLRSRLAQANIEARPLWKPMHLQPVFSSARAFIDGTSENLYRMGLSLPSGSALLDSQVDTVCNEVARFVSEQR